MCHYLAFAFSLYDRGRRTGGVKKALGGGATDDTVRDARMSEAGRLATSA